ncbi:exonuclease domain-containing protein [Polycladidibacter hongkongensis]|uniref:exonuclease domain-containing protein n=1 Tax=Polycladidibacter hongkongensis TaxID=1647556 RepID=UPI00082D5F54|nr:exonuclease domain-containing protein [Pseudovibrio hongkongensis]
MLKDLGLRLRIFLIFCGGAAAVAAVIILSMYLGHSRLQESGGVTAFVLAGFLSCLGLFAISAFVWLLFDENVAKPILRLSAAIRTRVHADVDRPIDLSEAKYLGDLAPAASAVVGRLSLEKTGSSGAQARAIEQYAREREQLAQLLSQIPVAIVLVSKAHTISLYDGQAADILAQVHVPRLGASIFDYFDKQDFLAALKVLTPFRNEAHPIVKAAGAALHFQLQIKRLPESDDFLVLIDNASADIAPEAQRPLVFNFDMSEQATQGAIYNSPLDELSFVVFDSETTGLMLNKDDIVQIGALRVVGGRIVQGEAFDLLVNPGRPIPPASTRVHGIRDEDVVGAPDPISAVAQFHRFAKDAVIVAHNANFDMAFVRRYAKRSGERWDHPVLDTVLLSAVVFGTNEVHTLDALCERLGISIPLEMRHTAIGDAKATAEALCKLLPILKERGFDSLEKVIKQTRKHGRLLKDLN